MAPSGKEVVPLSKILPLVPSEVDASAQRYLFSTL